MRLKMAHLAVGEVEVQDLLQMANEQVVAVVEVVAVGELQEAMGLRADGASA